MTGFFRTAALAAVLGLSVVADAYNAASSLPTMLLVLVTGGTLSAAVVPILAQPETDDERRRAAASVLAAVVAAAAVATVALAVLAPLLGRLLSVAAEAGQAQDERVRLTVLFILLLAPQVLLLGISVAAASILTAAGRLAVLGLAPVLTNVVALLGIGAFALLVAGDGAQATATMPVVVLGASATVALGAAALLQLSRCRDLLPPWNVLRRSVSRQVLRRLLTVGRWSLLYVVSSQIGLVVVLVAAGESTGVLSAYQWSFAVMQLPYAVLAVPLFAATVPRLSRASGDLTRVRSLVRSCGTALVLLVVPAAAALAVFADLVAGLLLAGRSDAEVEVLTGSIRLFAAAFVPFAAFQFLTRVSYALGHPSWPALVNLAVNGVNIVGAVLALAWPGQERLLQVLVISYGASYLVGCLLMSWQLHRGAHVNVRLGLGSPALRAFGWTSLAGAVAVAARSTLPMWPGASLAAAALAACGAIALWPLRGLLLDRGRATEMAPSTE